MVLGKASSTVIVATPSTRNIPVPQFFDSTKSVIAYVGHEITGEVIETGSDVEFIKTGDLCSVPFNIACGRCAACKRGDTGVCLETNPARPGAAYGYVDMGGWIGGQSGESIPRSHFPPLRTTTHNCFSSPSDHHLSHTCNTRHNVTSYYTIFSHRVRHDSLR